MVIAKFSPNHMDPDQKLPRVVVYGHYDVQNVVTNKWDSPPFRLTGRNGYLYGRGATDDKGPIIAMYVSYANSSVILLCNFIK